MTTGFRHERQRSRRELSMTPAPGSLRFVSSRPESLVVGALFFAWMVAGLAQGRGLWPTIGIWTTAYLAFVVGLVRGKLGLELLVVALGVIASSPWERLALGLWDPRGASVPAMLGVLTAFAVFDARDLAVARRRGAELAPRAVRRVFSRTLLVAVSCVPLVGLMLAVGRDGEGSWLYVPAVMAVLSIAFVGFLLWTRLRAAPLDRRRWMPGERLPPPPRL